MQSKKPTKSQEHEKQIHIKQLERPAEGGAMRTQGKIISETNTENQRGAHMDSQRKWAQMDGFCSNQRSDLRCNVMNCYGKLVRRLGEKLKKVNSSDNQ